MSAQHQDLLNHIKDPKRRAQAAAEIEGLPSEAYGDGYLEHRAHSLLDDLEARYGFQGAREFIAERLLERTPR